MLNKLTSGFNRIVHGPEAERGVEPNRYVDHWGAPVGGRSVGLKRVFHDPALLAMGVYMAGAAVLSDNPAKSVTTTVVEVPFLWASRSLSKNHVRRLLGPALVQGVIDTNPTTGERSDLDSIGRAITVRNWGAGGVFGTGLTAGVFLSIPPLGVGYAAASASWVNTNHKVVKGDWVVVPRDGMKKREEKPEHKADLQPMAA